MNALLIELPVEALATPCASMESLAVEAEFMLAIKLLKSAA